jgi:hypothetical protein
LHVSEQIREAFIEAVENGRKTRANEFIGMLWNCTDIMPASTCDDLDMPKGSSYAHAARKIRKETKKEGITLH